MTEPFIGEIQLYGFNFPPRSWAYCNGATLSIAQNTALFSLIGTIYGGNGQTTFQLPNFAGRAGCQQGNGPGLSPRTLGEAFGVNTVTLTSNQIPAHSHGMVLYSQNDASKRSHSPAANSSLSVASNTSVTNFIPSGPVNTQFAPNMLSPSQGGGQPHQNQQPYLGINFCIALQGIYPSFP
ncbi:MULTISPECIES: tail fiber protein [unclassified Arenimonas]|uniref:phage tail protein n=1 Tax=unclassified Arenimonas TaxID=2641713 RepID=UPI00086EDE55|nr:MULTISPECIES: tail fiber protein [unclassified Arenimonas]ODS63692.1 MAG: microcystin-dependent protein [Arenimonas sp. SCN 70-307]